MTVHLNLSVSYLLENCLKRYPKIETFLKREDPFGTLYFVVSLDLVVELIRVQLKNLATEWKSIGQKKDLFWKF